MNSGSGHQPCRKHKFKTRSVLGVRALVLAVLCAFPAACARPVGDFGRAAPDYIHDAVMPGIGAVRARIAGEPVSDLNDTDAEATMANRIWRFLVSPNAHDWFFDIAAELTRTRLLPGPGPGFSPDRYYNWLHATPFRSAVVRYNRLDDDVEADIETLPATFASICAVEKIDRERAFAAGALTGISAKTRAQIRARRAENASQVAMFVHALRYRARAYDYALNHLLVETPNPRAEKADAALRRLSVLVARATSGAFCSPPAISIGRAAPKPPIRRYRPPSETIDPDLPAHAS